MSKHFFAAQRNFLTSGRHSRVKPDANTHMLSSGNGKNRMAGSPALVLALSFCSGLAHEMAETGFSNISHIQNANMSGKHKSHKCFVPLWKGCGGWEVSDKNLQKYFHMWKCVKCKSWSLPFVYPGCWLLTATSWLLDNSSSFCCLIFHFVSCPVCFALLRSWLFFVCSVCTMWASGAVAKEITTNPFVKLQTETEPSPPLIQLPLMAFSVLVFGQSAAMCFLEAGMRLISLLEIIFLR